MACSTPVPHAAYADKINCPKSTQSVTHLGNVVTALDPMVFNILP